MEVWPAIDIRGGRCVRLCQGDYAREIVFNLDPLAPAQHWIELGAKRLHLVDLDGARSGTPQNLEIIGEIARQTGLPCQVGGGIRSEETIACLCQAGVARVVIGTRAIQEPDWFRQMCRQFPGKIVLGVDTRQGFVATHGWLETSQITGVQLITEFADEPLAAVVYTDISADGMLSGVNLSAIAEVQMVSPFPVIASGGVTRLEDVQRLKEIGVAGCIIGRALYEGKLDLRQVLELAEDL